MALVLYLLGRANYDWRHAKHALKSHHRFLSELKDFTLSCANEGFAEPDRFISVEERLKHMQIDSAYVTQGKHSRKGDIRSAVVRLLAWLVYMTSYFRVIQDSHQIDGPLEGSSKPTPVQTTPLPAPTEEEKASVGPSLLPSPTPTVQTTLLPVPTEEEKAVLTTLLPVPTEEEKASVGPSLLPSPTPTAPAIAESAGGS